MMLLNSLKFKHVHTRVVLNFLILFELKFLIGLNAYLLDEELILPDLNIDLPMQKQIRFLAETGSILNCDLNFYLSSFNGNKSSTSYSNPKYAHKFYWMVYSFLEQRFVRILDHTGDLLKQVDTEEGTSLSFLPFKSGSYNANVHNNYYRCILQYETGHVLGGQVVKVQALVSKNVELHVYDQHVEIGSSVLLKCVYSTDLRSYIRVSGWLSDDGLIILPSSAYVDNIQIIKQRKYNILSTGELYISNVSEKDSNRRFKCQVINIMTGERYESISWARLTLTVRSTKLTGPILSHTESMFGQSKSVLIVQEHESILVSCNFNANPFPHIQWYKRRVHENKTAIKMQTGNFLFIPSVTSSDIGQFFCIANNSHGQNKLELTIKLQPQLQFKLSSSAIHAQLGQEITINCSYISSSDQTYQVFWYKNMQKIQIDNIELTSGQIKEEDILKDENKYLNYKIIKNWLKIRSFNYFDSGIYQCFLRPLFVNLSNKEHSSISFTSNVHTSYVNSFSSASTAESLLPLSSLSSILFNNQTHPNSNAVYLLIKQIKPTFNVAFSEQLKLPGNELWLKCVANGVPAPKITWKINGIPLYTKRAQITHFKLDNRKTASHVNISSLIVTDAGHYECIASNSAGQISNQARINVMGLPGINLNLLLPSTHNFTAISGKPFTLNCPFYGYPLEQVIFFHHDKKIVSGDHFTEIAPGQIRINQVRKEDDGIYKCVVIGLTSERNEANIFLKVVLPPSISAFDFPKNLEEKMRASVICSVTSGDPPISMHWFRNNQLISNSEKQDVSNLNNFDAALMNSFSNLDFQIVALNQFVSSLLINKLSSEYTGNYTCMANNEISSANYSAYLQVKAQAKFTIKPLAYQSSIVGEPIRLNCQANGYPQPVIRWKYLGNSLVSFHIKMDYSNLNNQYNSNDQNFLSSVSILSSPRVHVLENGSLIIKQVQLEDEGNYQCEASNGIGRPVEAIAQLVVFQAPRLKLTSDNIHTLNLNSFSSHNSISSSFHQHPGSSSVLPKNNNFHHKIYSTNNFHLNNNQYIINMMNNFSPVVPNINIFTVKHGQKTVFVCKVHGTHPINIEWTHNDRLLSKLNSVYEDEKDQHFTNDLFYSIKEQITSDQFKKSILTIEISSRNNSGLYSCQANNFYGTDKSFIKLFVQEAPSSPNLNIEISELTARSVVITWSINYTGNCLMTGYEIQYKQLKLNSNQTRNLEYENRELVLAKSKNYTLTSNPKLNKSEQLAAKSSSYSTEAHVLKKLNSMQTDNSVWNQANILFVTTNEVQDSVATNNGKLENMNKQLLLGSYIIRKLYPRTIYMIRIRAQNQMGFSPFSNSITILTKKEAPTITPTNITCVPLNSKSMLIYWQIPLTASKSTSENNQLIEGFYIGYKIASSEDNFNFITYYTGELDLQNSTIASIQDKHRLQTDSTFNALQLVDGNKLAFNYTLELLRKSTKYSFLIQAFNSEGAGPYSNEVFSETFENDPPKSPSIKIESIGNFNVTITWKMYSDTNQVQGFLLNYKQIVSSSDVQSFNKIEANLDETSKTYETVRLPKFYRKYSLNNLNCGSKYLINLVSFNKVGKSEPSNELIFVTKGSAPIAPPRNSFIVPNIISATLLLNAWQDGNCSLTHFTIQYKQKNEFQWKFHSTVQANVLTQSESSQLSSSNSNLYANGGHHLSDSHLYFSNDNLATKNSFITSNDLNTNNHLNNFGQVVLTDLQPATWHDVLVQAFNQAGKTEITYIFATLTLDGATIAPLILSNENDHFNTVAGTFISNDVYLYALLQYGPFTFAFILLILFAFLSIYVIMMKYRLQHQDSIDQFARNTHQDSVSLNSYSNNKLCGSNLKAGDTLYETSRNLDNLQDAGDNCEQTDLHKAHTIYYSSMYAGDPAASLAHLTINNNQPTIANNSTYLTKIGSNFNSLDSENMNNLIAATSSNANAFLNNPTIGTYIHNVAGHAAHLDCYSFNDTMDKCIKNFPLSSFINNENLAQSLENSCALINCKNNSSHVYDIPHCQQIE